MELMKIDERDDGTARALYEMYCAIPSVPGFLQGRSSFHGIDYRGIYRDGVFCGYYMGRRS
jgi:hypothetical protein